jgi:hypothetical protein
MRMVPRVSVSAFDSQVAFVDTNPLEMQGSPVGASKPVQTHSGGRTPSLAQTYLLPPRVHPPCVCVRCPLAALRCVVDCGGYRFGCLWLRLLA